MSFFAHAQESPTPRTDAARKIALFYAVLLVIMLVAQLFTFDTFVPFFETVALPGGALMMALIAPVITTSELAALPFLLRVRISYAFRWLSMLSGWAVAALWLLVSISALQTYPTPETVGFLGTAVNVVPGAWAIGLSLLFGIMAAWASWGMWPGTKRVKK